MKSLVLAIAVAGPGLALLACSGGEPSARRVVQEGSEGETGSAGSYFDLGSSTVDVSAYPARLQEDYRLFADVCGSCHTVARALNSPYSSDAEWRQYVGRMRGKMKAMGIRLSGDAEEGIVEFLVYDSEVRKVGAKDAFEAEQGRLKDLFAKRRAGGPARDRSGK